MSAKDLNFFHVMLCVNKMLPEKPLVISQGIKNTNQGFVSYENFFCAKAV